MKIMGLGVTGPAVVAHCRFASDERVLVLLLVGQGMILRQGERETSSLSCLESLYQLLGLSLELLTRPL